MVSERTMARLAELAFGMPLHKQVIKLRMDYALDLLINTDKPVFEIAALCGYKEPYYFSKAFKKQFGDCPKSVKRSYSPLITMFNIFAPPSASLMSKAPKPSIM
ncbi:HTH-type transcriptional regulator CdhR [compost metagenome]